MQTLREAGIGQFLLWLANRFAPGLWSERNLEEVTVRPWEDLQLLRDERLPGRRRTDIEREKIAMAQDDRRKDYKTRCTVSWIIGEYDNLILSNGDALRKLRLLDMSDMQIKRLIPGLILDQKETK